MDSAEPGLSTNGERVANRQLVIDLLEMAFAEIAPDALLARLAAAGVPAGKVRTLEEVYAWDQVESQGLKVQVNHATAGPLTLPGPPLRFFAPGVGGEVETTRRDHTPPPVLGAEGEAIRAWLSGGGVPHRDGDDVKDGHAT